MAEDKKVFGTDISVTGGSNGVMSELELFSPDGAFVLSKLSILGESEIFAEFSGGAFREENNLCFQYSVTTTGKIKVPGFPEIKWDSELVDFGKYCWNPEESLCLFVKEKSPFLGGIYETGTSGTFCLEGASLCIQENWEFYVKVFNKTVSLNRLPKACIPIPV